MVSRSLHLIVKAATGQDVYRCRECQLCDISPQGDMDVPLTTILKLIMFDDDEVLTSRTVWSDRVLVEASHACKRGLDLKSILLALRAEATKRGMEID